MQELTGLDLFEEVVDLIEAAFALADHNKLQGLIPAQRIWLFSKLFSTFVNVRVDEIKKHRPVDKLRLDSISKSAANIHLILHILRQARKDGRDALIHHLQCVPADKDSDAPGVTDKFDLKLILMVDNLTNGRVQTVKLDTFNNPHPSSESCLNLTPAQIPFAQNVFKKLYQLIQQRHDERGLRIGVVLAGGVTARRTIGWPAADTGRMYREVTPTDWLLIKTEEDEIFEQGTVVVGSSHPNYLVGHRGERRSLAQRSNEVASLIVRLLLAISTAFAYHLASDFEPVSRFEFYYTDMTSLDDRSFESLSALRLRLGSEWGLRRSATSEEVVTHFSAPCKIELEDARIWNS